MWLALPPHQHCQFMMTSTHKIKHLPPPHNNLPTYQIFALASGRHLLYSCSDFHLVQLAQLLLSLCGMRFLYVYFYIHISETLTSVGHNGSQELVQAISNHFNSSFISWERGDWNADYPGWECGWLYSARDVKYLLWLRQTAESIQ